MIYYNLSGYVLGNYWGGGKGAYSMIRFDGVEDINEWKKEWSKKLDELDSGMGYESVYAVLVNVEKVITVEVDGKKYSRSEYDSLILGECTDEEIEFLENL